MGKCSKCHGTGKIKNEILSGHSKCKKCYGTGFDGRFSDEDEGWSSYIKNHDPSDSGGSHNDPDVDILGQC